MSRMDKVLAVRGTSVSQRSRTRSYRPPVSSIFLTQNRRRYPPLHTSLDLSLTEITILHKDSDATVQPGVPWMDLNAELESRGIGLFLPLDPGPGAFWSLPGDCVLSLGSC